MSIKIVQLGSKRAKDEGLRLGTVRRPPRGVPKKDFAKRDFYDVWMPILSPSLPLMKKGVHAQTEKEWNAFIKGYKAEMKKPEAAHALELLAALSQDTNLSVGCYCEDESHCHRSILRELLKERGAKIS